MEPEISDQAVKLRDMQGEQGFNRAAPECGDRVRWEPDSELGQDAVTATPNTNDSLDARGTFHETLDHSAQV